MTGVRLKGGDPKALKFDVWPFTRHAAPSTFIFRDLATASDAFLRHSALRGALQALYVGPYEVLDRSDKTYKIDFQGSAKRASIDRLKPAYVLHSRQRTRFTTGPSSRRHNALRSAGTLSGFPGVQRSQRGWCGGCYRLAHPLSQGIASPPQTLLS